MRIIYRQHLKRRLKERKFPNDYPKKIYQKARFRLFDIETKHYIDIAKMKHAKKRRDLMISHDIIGEDIEIITIHPIPREDIKRRIERGRWKKYEEDKK